MGLFKFYECKSVKLRCSFTTETEYRKIIEYRNTETLKPTGRIFNNYQELENSDCWSENS